MASNSTLFTRGCATRDYKNYKSKEGKSHMDIMDTYKIICILTNFYLPILNAYPSLPTIFSLDVLCIQYSLPSYMVYLHCSEMSGNYTCNKRERGTLWKSGHIKGE